MRIKLTSEIIMEIEDEEIGKHDNIGFRDMNMSIKQGKVVLIKAVVDGINMESGEVFFKEFDVLDGVKEVFDEEA